MKQEFRFSLIALFIACSLSLYAQTDKAESGKPVIDEGDPVIAALDSLLARRLAEDSRLVSDTQCLNVHDFKDYEIPSYPDSILRERLKVLDEKTPFNLVYNDWVDAYIDVYTRRRRELTSSILGLSHLYYPLFEEKLDQFNIPLEMKHLAVVESALNPTARSRMGAKGLWQFMYRTGLSYDLKIGSYIDERYDPLASTIAACRYFRFLYGMYGDWNLVLAAYNSGPGNVNKAIRRSGGERDYWKLRRYLPRETRGYVPAFIAVNYVMNHAADHNLYPVEPIRVFQELDTLEITGGPLLFSQISKYTGVEREELEALNPAVKANVIPRLERKFPLYLPREAVGAFIANRDSIFHIPQEDKKEVEEKLAEPQEYVVQSGDVLGLIAERHGVRVSQILEWNGMRTSRIYPGQRLKIHASKEVKGLNSSNQSGDNNESDKNRSSEENSSSSKFRYHVVETGDTLWDIANKYSGVSVSQIKQLNRGINYRRLKPGQRIKISTQGS